MNRYFLPALLIISLLSCCISCDFKKSTLLPSITGKSGEIIVVISDNLKQTAVKQALDSILLQEYEVLNQIEPIFSPVYIPPDAFTSIFQTHRNILFIKMQPQDTIRVGLQNNLWASPQLVISLSAPTADELVETIHKFGKRLTTEYEKADSQRAVENIRKYEEKKLRDIVEKTFDSIQVYFPAGYQLKAQRHNFVWTTMETPSTTQAILVYSYAWTKPQLPSKEEAIEQRNLILQLNLPGTIAGSYMQTALEIPPIYTNLSENMPIAELRGLWNVQGDFMGGPFISKLYYLQKQQKVVVVEGFVYAPHKNKRNYMREVEAILSEVQPPLS